MYLKIDIHFRDQKMYILVTLLKNMFHYIYNQVNFHLWFSPATDARWFAQTQFYQYELN